MHEFVDLPWHLALLFALCALIIVLGCIIILIANVAYKQAHEASAAIRIGLYFFRIMVIDDVWFFGLPGSGFNEMGWRVTRVGWKLKIERLRRPMATKR